MVQMLPRLLSCSWQTYKKLYRRYIAVILGYIGIMENKVDSTIYIYICIYTYVFFSRSYSHSCDDGTDAHN